MFRPKSEAQVKAEARDCDRPGWLLEPCGNARPRGMAAGEARVFGYHAALQNPAYRLPGNLGYICAIDTCVIDLYCDDA